jgi:small-conductance mechanosensitive channel
MLQDLAHAFRLSPNVVYSIAFGVLIFGALLLGFALNWILHRETKKFRDTWGELVFALLESLPIPLLLLAALYTGLESLELPTRYERIGSKLILALVLLVVFYFPTKMIILFLRRVSQRNPGMERITQPAAFVVRALFALLAVIIFLENLGISLTAVWTTLGVGSVAVALALQETLSNFFSGLYLVADQPVSPGDYIKLDAGQEGYVLRIGWRSTSLRTPSNNLVVIPNSTLAKAVITNFSRPDARMSLSIPVSVAYGYDARRIEQILLEVAREAARETGDGLLSNPEPSVGFIPGFGQSSMDFTLTVQIRRIEDQGPVQSELRKRIQERFQKEGIETPFPTRTIVLGKSVRETFPGLGAKSKPPDA